jgi:hypothetical protein
MAKFVRNPGWERELFRDEAIRAQLSEAGDEVLAAAKTIAAEHADTGEFEESMHKVDGEYSTGRPYSRVYSDDPASLSKEFGTSHSEPIRALGRAIRSI